LTYRITFKRSVWKDLDSIDRKEADKVLSHIKRNLSQDAAKYPALSGKFAGLRKCRVGDYRIIFSVLDDTVLILRIRHRREVYR
jgi:mRNA interferase RelE/StbE